MKKIFQLFFIGTIICLPLGFSAQITYFNPTDATLTGGQTQHYDLNADGSNDVSFTIGGSTFCSLFVPVSSPGTSHVSTQITTSAGSIVDKLALAEAINSTKFFGVGSSGSCTACISWNAQWFTTSTDAYVGFRFTLNGDAPGTFHYAWVRLDVTIVSNAVSSVTIKDFAYENTAGTGIVAGDKGLVTSISVTGQSGAVSVLSGNNLQMISTVLPANATDRSVTWSVVAGTGSATINATGLLSGINPGTVTVVATANDASGITGTRVITVNPILVNSINVSGQGGATTVSTCSPLQMVATISPSNASNPSVTWSVTPGTGSASINSSGVLTGITVGYVIVRAAADDGSGIFGSRAITITSTPNAPTGTAIQSFCENQTVSDLNATGTAIKWYDQASGGQLLLGTDLLVDGTSYFASQTVSGCESINRFELTVNLTALPLVSSTASDSRCENGTLQLGATPSSGTINWYDAPTAGNLVGTGSTWTTPSITSTTIYYAEALDASCVSTSRSAVTASVYDCSELTAGWCGNSVAGVTNTVSYTSVPGATNYEIWVQGPSGYSQTVLRNINSTNFKLAWFSGILYNSTYTVRVKAFVGGSWTPYGDACNLSTPTVGNTKLIPAHCGITLTSLDQILEYNEIYGATNYEIWVEGPNSYSMIKPRNNNFTSFKMAWFTGLQPGGTYTVKVRSFVDGAWGAWGGQACDVTVPATPTTQLVPGNCGHTLITPDEALQYNPISEASNYQIWVQGPSSYSELMYRNSSKTIWRLSWFSGLTTNTTYSVQVRSYVNGVWSAWGPACDVTTLGTLSMMQNNTPEAFDGSVSLEDVSIEAYPNPNKGEFTISSSHEGTFKIVNELGQVVQTFEITKENNFEIKVNSLDAGVYFVTGTIHGNVLTNKIIVQ